MSQSIRLVLVLHNHQPIGNFQHVFEQAYQDSYLPFLDVFEPYTDLRIALHTSGPLMEWLDDRHPEYLDRLAHLVQAGRVEIVGGAFYEPILAMIPARDRVGQIRTYTDWLEGRLESKVRGMWVPERVWEQSMTRDITAAGIEYTLLDDFHFKNAGLTEGQLHGYYVTEDEGKTLCVLPGSERLRYLIPFHDPHETIDYLREVAAAQPGAVVVFGDDGEKFGTWPETNKHVYEDGWLRRFFDQLSENADWIDTTTPTEALRAVPPIGTVYLPEGSYREMTEWALPADRQVEYDHVRHVLQDAGQWQSVAPFVRGGYWRNFKVKYPETAEMYSRMMTVSRRLQSLRQATTARTADVVGEVLDQARTELYRGQCNCSYWHGAFGGIYLPHLRNAVYRHLIAAENLLDRAGGRGTETWAESSTEDLNFDGRDEVVLATDRLIANFEPSVGGRLYELDVRNICHNLLATLARRPEAYHGKVQAGPGNCGDDVASIHDRVVFKQEGLDKMLHYDNDLRKSLQDHFFDDHITLADVAAARAVDQGDFATGSYTAETDSAANHVQVRLVRSGMAFGVPLTVTKTVTLSAGSSRMEVTYLIEGLPQDRPLHFAVEFNFAGLPAQNNDRYFYDADRNHLGHLGTQLDLCDSTGLGLIDEWLGIDLGLTCNRPTDFWTFPINSVSQSEGGFEAVHQSVVLMPHWMVQGDAQGRWGISMDLSIDTSLAEGRIAARQMAIVH